MANWTLKVQPIDGGKVRQYGMTNVPTKELAQQHLEAQMKMLTKEGTPYVEPGKVISVEARPRTASRKRINDAWREAEQKAKEAGIPDAPEPVKKNTNAGRASL